MSPTVTNPKTATKHLTLTLAGEGYSLPIHHVREIIRIQKITPMPNLPTCIKGVINLRGRIIPLLDLRARFGLPMRDDNRNCIVVVAVSKPGRPAVPTGLIVDSVEDVATVRAEDVAPPPEFGSNINTDCLLGLTKTKDEVKMLLNIERVLDSDTFDKLTAAPLQAA